MKLRILILSIFGTFIFNSCTSDSNSSNSTSQNLDPNTILPKKIIREDVNYESTSYDFFYNQSKLDHIHCEYFYGNFLIELDFNFTYNGNLISKIEVIDNAGQVYSKTEFTYLNNKLVNKQITEYDVGFVVSERLFTYTYNSSNNIITRATTYTDINGNPYNGTDTFTITNNLVFKNDEGYSSSHSPFKNIIGIQDALIEGGTEYDDDTIFDIISIFFSTTKNIIDLQGGRFVYIYNDIEFPTTALFYEDIGIYPPLNYQIFYQ
jgi:hypothetical protein